MAAFERVPSGIPEMDEALDNIRLGDNVVFRVSELQIRWATDLMMGNFFRVTCPFLFTLDTVAFFPIIRGKHSFHAINKKTLHFAPQKLSAYKNIISDFTHTYGDIVQVYDLKDTACTLYYDLEENHLMLKL